MHKFIEILDKIPLENHHNGKIDMCEQGVVAAAFQEFCPTPIPLGEFPFARAFEKDLDFGDELPNKNYWGIHFGAAFRVRNKHFHQAVDSGQIVSVINADLIQKTRWLSGGSGQWGIPGLGISEEGAAFILREIGDCSGRDVLEIGTSRGRFAYMLNLLGANVTTLDPVNRGAKKNLAGLKTNVVLEDGKEFLQKNSHTFDLILVDLHGNTDETWQVLWSSISKSVKFGGKVIINNLFLERIDKWQDQNGVRKLADRLHDVDGWKISLFKVPSPGFLVVEKVND
jgi:predicted O-methyltransferase YrrM